MVCEGCCRVSSVAKFGDFWRLVVEVLQWSRCVGGFLRRIPWKKASVRSSFGLSLGFLFWWSAHGREEGFLAI